MHVLISDNDPSCLKDEEGKKGGQRRTEGERNTVQLQTVKLRYPEHVRS
jgi:hypothetical protein